MAEPPAGPTGLSRARRWAAAAALALLPGLLAACLPLRTEPELLRRYDGYASTDTSGLVEVSVFTTAGTGEEGGPLLSRLSPSAQNAYVRSLAGRTSSAEGLQRALAAPLGEPGAGGDAVDHTRFRRRLVVSVERRGPEGGADGSLAPGARIAWLRIALGVDGSRVRFASWSRFATRYDTVELGRMELSRGAEAGADLDLASRGLQRVTGSAGMEIGRSVGLDESLPLQERYVSNGILRPDSLILLQEGAVGVDLVGNSVVDVELRLAGDRTVTGTVHRFEGLFDAGGAPRPPDSVRVLARPLVRPDSAAAIAADLRFESLVRSIRPGRGDDTFSEGDDSVRFLRSREDAGTVTLVPAEELRSSVWSVVTGDCRILQVQAPDPAPGAVPAALRFLEFGEARRFVRWLRERATTTEAGGSRARDAGLTVGGRSLFLAPGDPLRPAEAENLFVQLHPLNWSAGAHSICP